MRGPESIENAPEIEGSPEILIPQFVVFNGHTDGSAPIVSRFINESTGLPNDLAYRHENPTRLVLPIKKEDGTVIELEQMDQWDVDRARSGGERLVNMAAFLNPIDMRTGKFTVPDRLLTTYMLHDAVYSNLLKRRSNVMQEVTTYKDLDEALKNDKTGLIRSVEGVYGEFTRADLDKMADTVKIWCFMWNFDNPDTGKAAATTGSPEDTGLTLKGKDFINHLAVERGVAIDLSHASDKTAKDVLEITQKGVPAIATHSGSRAIIDTPRNLSDELAVQIVGQGGFIGIPFVNGFIDNSPDGAVDHIEHFASLGLINNIALGPDFDGVTSKGVVKGLENAEVAYRNIAETMRRRGFSNEHIQGVLFDNALRYMQTYLFPAA